MSVKKTTAAAAVLVTACLLMACLEGYYGGSWPAIRHDAHNSDHIRMTFGDVSGLSGLKEINWILRDQGHPSVLLTAVSISTIAGRDVVIAVTGKVAYPNLHVYDMDGNALWHSAPSTAALDPGPESCAMASAALVDNSGNIYISDCHYLFCYGPDETDNSEGNRSYTWKVPLPGLRQYSETDNLWHAVSDPLLPGTMAKPFVSLFFTRDDAEFIYVGGISTDGGIGIFDPYDGSLVATSHLIQPPPAEAADWGSDGPCSPDAFALLDDPMVYDINPDAEDGMIPFGVWCTGNVPETDDPDADYFMNPCQISAYLANNTASTGAMVVNTPAVIRTPEYRSASTIFVNGSESPALDVSQLTEDAVLYRVDFFPEEARENRLVVRNYTTLESESRDFSGRMVNGVNSGSSPPVTPNEKFIVSGDNNGWFYCFSTRDGSIVWKEKSGALLGSATLPQDEEEDGSYTIYTWGDSKLWVFNIDPDTGERNYTQTVSDLPDYVIDHYWRNDDPGYAVTFRNSQGHAYIRTAIGASIIVASDDYLVLSYSVGWRDPDRLDAFFIPTHNVLLFINRETLRNQGASPEPGAIINAAVMDSHGTLEQAPIFTRTSEGTLRGFLVYGSQSTTLAQFLERNDGMPEAMKRLYVKPQGGIRIVEPEF